MAVVYSIRDWDEHFEIAQSRKVQKTWSWVATPLKHDGKSFRRIMLMPDGPAIYGAWMLIVQVAAKCPTRGVLADADGPLTADDLAIKTGCPAAVFTNALKVLTSQHIGWMVGEQWEGGSIALPLHNHTKPNKNQPTNQPNTLPEHSQQNGSLPAADGGMNGRMVFDLTWDAVGDRLAALEIANWRQAIAEAKACGCTPPHAHALIDHWEANPGRWKVGAIVWRFKHANPQTPVERCWPEPGQKSAEVEARASRESEKLAAERAVAEATSLIQRGQRAKRPRDEILAALVAAGLDCPDWFANPPVPLSDEERRKFHLKVAAK